MRISIFLVPVFLSFFCFISLNAQNFSGEKEGLALMHSKNRSQLFLIQMQDGEQVQQLSDAYIVGFYSQQVAIVQFLELPSDLNIIQSWAPYLPQNKYPKEILNWAIENDETYHIYIKTVADIDLGSIQKNLQAINVNFENIGKWQSTHLYDIWIREEQLPLLAAQNWIVSLDAVTEMEPLNAVARSMTHVRLAQAPVSIGGENLSGEGVTMGIGDDGIIKHVDVLDRIVENFNPNIGNSHATHVAVTASGAGIKDELIKGFAPKASLINHFFNGVLIYGPSLNETYNMSITNNSYAARVGDCNFAGRYTSESQALDEMAFSHPKLLHVFAAGNDGNRTCPPFSVGFGTTVGAYQPSKNTLTVANLGKMINSFHPSSSKGPIKDGRIKPEIAAIGRQIMSGVFNNNYALNSGTSMASPNVAGAAALITEKYKSIHGGQLPDGALLKTLLMNGAMDIANPGPDFKYGFGLMDINQSIQMLKNERYLQGTINHGATQSIHVNVPANVSRAKLMLYWNDVAAIPTPEDPSIPKLINDLDLQMTTPDGTILQPWVLDPNNPDNYAVRGVERTNNVEQITIDNPGTGNYAMQVKGFNISSTSQSYVLAWDFEMDEINLLFPIGGEALKAGDSMFVYFKSPTTTSTFSCLFSIDNGITWVTLSGTIPADHRHYFFKIEEGISAAQCRIRIVENTSGKVVSSNNFSINSRIIVSIAPDAKQCPGSISIQWTAASTATAYAIFLEKEGEMIAMDTVPSSQLHYTFSGLSTSENYWVSAAPIVGTTTAIRGVAINSIPDFGDCTGIELPSFDMALNEITLPKTGRILTSTSLQNEEMVSVRVQNRGRLPISAIRLLLSVNESEIGHQDFSLHLPAGKDTVLTINILPIDLSAIGEYHIQVSILNTMSPDAYRSNDSTDAFIQLVSNEPVDINEGYIENFEFVNVKRYKQNHIGIGGADKWDFTKTPGYGRISSFINPDVSINGDKAMSMDLWDNSRDNPDSSSINSLIVNLNLAAYDVNSNEVRADFLYRFSGRPKTLENQAVFLRGDDLSTWIPVTNLDTTFAGNVKSSGDISLNDFLIANSQTFSSSTQFKIEQRDTSLITDGSFGNGLTVDSFRLYAITNDAALLRIGNPGSQGCDLSNTEKIQIEVRNNVFYALENVPVAYQINGGPIIEEVIANIPAKSNLIYTFTPEENFETIGSYSINAWIAIPEDDFKTNDSILHFEIHHQPIIKEYPYLATFESDHNHFYTHDSSAFGWGEPRMTNIQNAANGKKAWHTNLIRRDSIKHRSYLYTPCFEITDLENPMLSFSYSFFAPTTDSSAPATVAWVEYSFNGKDWQRLGSAASGYNWYNQTANYWSNADLGWRNASHLLPKEEAVISIRFVFDSYPTNSFAGFAIDDIHIYEMDKEIAKNPGTGATNLNLTTGSNTIWEDEYKYVSIETAANLGNTFLSHNVLTTAPITSGNETILPINLIINPSNVINSNYQVGFYVPHAVVEKARTQECNSCLRPKSIYELSIATYTAESAQEYNNVLQDNQTGTYVLLPKEQVYYLPYMNGYIAQFETHEKGEFWFYSGGLSGLSTPNHPDVILSGEQYNNTNFNLHWQSTADIFIDRHFLERKNADGNFEMIHEKAAGENLEAEYNFVDKPSILNNPLVYRVRYVSKLGETRFTNELTFNWNKMGTFSLYPNPVNENALTFTWHLETLAKIDYQIVDILGRVYINGTIEPLGTIGSHTFDLSRIGLAPGMHILQLKTDKEKWAEKFVYIK